MALRLLILIWHWLARQGSTSQWHFSNFGHLILTSPLRLLCEDFLRCSMPWFLYFHSLRTANEYGSTKLTLGTVLACFDCSLRTSDRAQTLATWLLFRFWIVLLCQIWKQGLFRVTRHADITLWQPRPTTNAWRPASDCLVALGKL